MAANDIRSYSGEQIVLSSGRLLFNARANDIYLNAKRYINLSAGDKLTIDVGSVDSDDEENMFLINAPKIQFGLDRYGLPEPIVKGEALDSILSQIMEAVATYSTMVQAAAIVPGPLMAIMLAPATSFLQGRFQAIKFDIQNIKSDITYTI
jgi:hypothetical protein